MHNIGTVCQSKMSGQFYWVYFTRFHQQKLLPEHKAHHHRFCHTHPRTIPRWNSLPAKVVLTHSPGVQGCNGTEPDANPRSPFEPF